MVKLYNTFRQISRLTQIKAFAEDNLKSAQVLGFLSKRLDNIVRKGENAGDQHFLLFPQCFQCIVFIVIKTGMCAIKGKLFTRELNFELNF